MSNNLHPKSLANLLNESEQKYRKLALSLEKAIEEKTEDLRRKNKELIRSEERYHKMVEEVEDYAIILLDDEGCVQNWNKGAERIKGYKEAEILGKSFKIFYPPEDVKNGVPDRYLAEAREKGKVVFEAWRVRKDGSHFWGSVVITALHGYEGEVIGFSKVTRDLTERKIAEDKLREYSRVLEFQNNELEEFAYATSHDMKEPLRKIHLYTSYVCDNPNNVLDEKSREYLSRSINAVKRMNNLIEDLLRYSKTTLSVKNFAKVNLNKVLSDIVTVHQEELEVNGIRVETEKLPAIQAIPFQCNQLFDNLLVNSIKYRHPDRPGLIRVRCRRVSGREVKELRERPIDSSLDYWNITFEDNGIGFEPANNKKVFEIFHRLNSPAGAGGSGIGLAICKKIMINHGGMITASGKTGQGACFDLYFPVNMPGT